SNQYDIVITNMPFSLKGPFDEYRDNYYLGKANGNSLCIEHCLDATNKNYAERRIVLITLEGILHDRKYTEEQKEVWHYVVKNDGFTENKREEKEGENDFDIFWKFKDRNEEEKLKVGFQKLEIEKIKVNHYISIPGLYKKFDFKESRHETIPLAERFKERIASKDTSDYKLVPPKHFAYRPPGVN
ncbi:9287_t:CDS:2, partial [Racocetra persica]